MRPVKIDLGHRFANEAPGVIEFDRNIDRFSPRESAILVVKMDT